MRECMTRLFGAAVVAFSRGCESRSQLMGFASCKHRWAHVSTHGGIVVQSIQVCVQGT